MAPPRKRVPQHTNRLNRTKADRAEFDLLRLQGQLVERDVVAAAWGSRGEALRGRLVNLPKSIRRLSVVEALPAETVNLIVDEVEQMVEQWIAEWNRGPHFDD